MLLVSCTTPGNQFLVNDLPGGQVEHLGYKYELAGINISLGQVSLIVTNLTQEPLKFNQTEFMLVDMNGKQNYALDAMERMFECARSGGICFASNEEMPGVIPPLEHAKKMLRFRDRPMNLPFTLFRNEKRVMEITRKPE